MKCHTLFFYGCALPIAKALGIRQDGVSRLEKRSDLLLSTLGKAVKALGGDLQLIAAFPDLAPVVLSGLAVRDPSEQGSRVKKKRVRLRGIWKGKGSDRINIEEEIKAVRRELGKEILKRGERL